jgi:cytochrome c oxidase subunit III
MSSTVLAPPKPEVPKIASPPPANGGGSDGFGGGSPQSSRPVIPVDVAIAGVWVGMASITMLFAALSGALWMREAWHRSPLPAGIPHILYANTLILIVSSLTIEFARRALRQDHARQFAIWLYVTTGLGLVFVAGQWLAWRDLAAQGVYLSSNAGSAFFFVITAAHGLHLLGGIVALLVLACSVPRILFSARGRVAVEATAVYWHFIDALWVYILLLLIGSL